MSGAPVDRTAERAAQKAAAREGWDAVAQSWRRWWRVFEAAAQPLNERLVALARVGPGQRVLDVATGIGEPALTAARLVGPSGGVLAMDIAPRMIAVARGRAAELGLRNVGFVVADAEAPPLGAMSFDAALCRWGLMLLGDVPAALAGIRAALRPGARLAAAVWGPAERVPFIELGRRVAERELGLAPADPLAPGPFALAEPGRLADLLSGAGFALEREERFDVRFTFASAGEYADFSLDLSGAVRRALACAPAGLGDAARAALTRAAAAWAGAGGRVTLANEAVCAVARR